MYWSSTRNFSSSFQVSYNCTSTCIRILGEMEKWRTGELENWSTGALVLLYSPLCSDSISPSDFRYCWYQVTLLDTARCTLHIACTVRHLEITTSDDGRKVIITCDRIVSSTSKPPKIELRILLVHASSPALEIEYETASSELFPPSLCSILADRRKFRLSIRPLHCRWRRNWCNIRIIGPTDSAVYCARNVTEAFTSRRNLDCYDAEAVSHAALRATSWFPIDA